MRLTRQRWDTLSTAMRYWETEIETMEVGEDPGAVRERRRFESAMDYLLSIQPKQREEMSKTDLGWVVLGNYGSGWEVVMYCDDMSEALRIIGDYRQAEPQYAHRMRRETHND